MPARRRKDIDEYMVANPGVERDAARKRLNKFKLHSYTEGPSGRSERYVREGRPSEECTRIPAAAVARTSTLYDRDGEVAAQWVIEKPEDKDRWATLRAWADQLAADLPARPVVEHHRQSNDDLLTVYPVGDHHTGMLSWKHETGENYDIDTAEELLTLAIAELVRQAPAATDCLIPFLGDYFHYDSFDQVTPSHRNLLDADGRAPKMIGAGMRLMETTIETAAAKHLNVNVIVELGNHDPYTSMIAARWLARVYRDNPRIYVDTAPGHFHYLRYGNNLIGTHHGHGKAAKPAQLPGIMAHDRREEWGKTRYHYWYTGHVHHQSVYEFPGCRVESFRILAPADAYAHNEGYRAGREMNAIVLHREYGEVGRSIVNPIMLRRCA